MRLIPEITEFVAELEHFRHDLHANPELGFSETRTASRIAEKLSNLGLEVKTGYGKTGLVATLIGAGGPEGPKVGFRAEMDALPIVEETGHAHRSNTDGVMHACGHDGHCAMLLGAAMLLARDREFAGTIYFIFQPAEELLSGAMAMISDGVFGDHPAEAVFSIHNDPMLPMGSVLTTPGPFMAGADHFDLLVSGRSGHAARPEDCVDPVVLAAQIVTFSQSIISRSVGAADPAVLTFSKFHAGDSYNVIPDHAELAGTFRMMNGALSELMEDRLRAAAQSIAASFGGRAELEYRRACPVLVNTDTATKLAAKAAEKVVTQIKMLRSQRPIMGTEDFAYMVENRPGCLLRLGANAGNGPIYGLHNSRYDFNDDLIPIGASIWFRIAERFFGYSRKL